MLQGLAARNSHAAAHTAHAAADPPAPDPPGAPLEEPSLTPLENELWTYFSHLGLDEEASKSLSPIKTQPPNVTILSRLPLPRNLFLMTHKRSLPS